MTKRLATLCLALASACSAQADGDYEGDLLASLEGEVTTSRETATPDAEAMAIWLPNDDYEFLVPTADRVDVEGTFPSSFRLDLTEPPPAEGSYDGSGDFAIGFLTIVEAGTTTEDLSDPEGGFLLGIDEGHILVWAATDESADEFASAYQTGAIASGYHIIDVLGLTKAEDDQVEACHEASTTPEEEAACFELERDLYEARYPGEDFGSGSDLTFDRLKVSPTDLDTELSIDLKDSVAEMDVPDFS